MTFDLAHPPQPRPLWLRVLRAAPFWIASIRSIFVAVQAPRGRRPFQIHFNLFWREDLMTSMTKVAHLRSIAILFLLAVLAFGVHRLLVAFAVTELVGVGWEIAEATVIGHRGAVSDLAPNLVAGAVALAVIAGLRWMLARRHVAALAVIAIAFVLACGRVVALAKLERARGVRIIQCLHAVTPVDVKTPRGEGTIKRATCPARSCSTRSKPQGGAHFMASESETQRLAT